MKQKILLFGILLLVGVLAWQCGGEKETTVAQGVTAEFARFPGSPFALGYMNIDDIRNSDFQEYLDKKMNNPLFMDEDYRNFEELTGLEIRRDIDQIFIALEEPQKSDEPEFLMVVKGRFNPEKIVDYIKKQDEKQKLVSEEYKEFTIYSSQEKDMGFSFADESRMVAGKMKLLKKYLDGFQDSSENRAINSQLKAQIQSIRYKDGAWFVMSTEGIVNKMMNEFSDSPRARQFEGLRSLQQLNFSMKFDKMMHFNGVGVFSQAQNAELFRDMIRGFIATAKLTMSGDRSLVDILNKVNVTNDDKRVAVKFELSPREIEKLQNQRRKIAHLP